MTAPLGLPFGGFVSFLRSPVCQDLDALDADIAIVGFPCDEGSGYLPGTRFGPRRLREASMRFRGGVIQGGGGFWDIDEDRVYLDDVITNGRIVDCGDVDVIVTRPDETWDNASEMVAKVARAGALPVVMGGDHGITYPVVRGFEEPLTVVQLDAHVDYQPFVHDITHSHANPMRMAATLGHVERLVQVGVRSFRTPPSDIRDSLADGNTIITTRQVRAAGPEALASELAEGTPVYVSIDVDVLDPPLVPGTGSPEPSGLTYDELRDLLFAVAGRTRVVGFDLVEVNPMLDVRSELTAFIGAQLIIEFLSRIVDSPFYAKRPGQRVNEGR